MNKIFFYNIIFFNLFCGVDNQQYLLNVVNGDKNELKKIEYKKISKVNNISRRRIFISYGGLKINYGEDKEFEIYENSGYQEYKNFIEELVIPYFGKFLDKKDELEKNKDNLNLEFIKIFIVKLLTDYFPLNLENLNFKEKKGIFFKENIKKNFLEKFFDFYDFIENIILLTNDKNDLLIKLEEFKSKNLKNGEKNFLNFYSFNLLENLAASSFLKLESDALLDQINLKEKKENFELDFELDFELEKDKFFEKSLLPFLGLIIKNFKKKYKEEIDKLKVNQQRELKSLNDKKSNLEKVIKNILIDFYRSSRKKYFEIFNDIDYLNEIFIGKSEDFFDLVNKIYLEKAANFFEKIKKDDIYKEGKENVNLLKSNIEKKKSNFLRKKDEVIGKTISFLESFIESDTLKNSEKI